MSTAKITLLGMYRHSKMDDDESTDLFHNLHLPTGIDKDKLINTILLNGAEFEVLYPRYGFMKYAIGIWSDKWYSTFDRWQKALSIEYNPLENYDRMEDWEDTSTGMNSDIRKASDLKNEILNDNRLNNARSVSSGSGGTEDKKAAYDTNTYDNFQKSDTTSSGSNSSSGLEYQNSLMDETVMHSENADSVNTTSANRSGRAHGNIGVTTSQQMLEAELEVARFNLYDEISYLFLSEFCIYTY